MKQKLPRRNEIDLDDVFRKFIRGVLINGVLTQEQIALYSGTSRSGLAHWLSGRRSMTLRNISKIIGLFSYERVVQFLIMQTAGASTQGRTRQQELVHLLEQINHLLKRQLQEAIEAEKQSEAGERPAGDHADQEVRCDAAEEG